MKEGDEEREGSLYGTSDLVRVILIRRREESNDTMDS